MAMKASDIISFLESKSVFHGTLTVNHSSIMSNGFLFSKENLPRNIHYNEFRFYFFQNLHHTVKMITEFMLDRAGTLSISLQDTYTEKDKEDIDITYLFRDFGYLGPIDKLEILRIVKRIYDKYAKLYLIYQLDISNIEYNIRGQEFASGSFFSSDSQASIPISTIERVIPMSFSLFIECMKNYHGPDIDSVLRTI